MGNIDLYSAGKEMRKNTQNMLVVHLMSQVASWPNHETLA